ncbi:unnamed protein product [marine sediment metagenome]|uniref:Uncharacterized protein n=1 Tax=marine sediment metagenome TaxID=412755 RepID=X0RZF1_9ZZZZ
MAYSVDKIKAEAEIVLETYKGRSGKEHAKSLSVWHMRVYANKVLFLCKHIEKLEAKMK